CQLINTNGSWHINCK
nr:Chain A, C1 Epitope [Hepacivirus hominis]5KZP_B Chain B, C1 Epitope [Hepacivirus hominis]5KZP_C Chain C, C1 Epitope [Hepacivirus hominis]5KZP_D Chain D, C1 Epitope [Hepacivirus hominis]